MKYLIIGTGSIGKRHIRNLLAIGTPPGNIATVETRKDRQKEVNTLFKIENNFTSLQEAFDAENYDAALVCSPTNLHIPMAIQLAEKKTHILMEKPLAHNLDRAKELKKIIKKNNLVFMVAYIFRFSPLTKKVKELLDQKSIGKILAVRGEFSEYLPDWHPWEDYRKFYMAKKTQGGGSILDQSHILDLIHYLLGGFKSVYAVNSKISSLEIEADDIAEMIINLKNGIIASVHTDIFGRDHKKSLEIKGEKGNILWDFYLNEIRHYEADNKCIRLYRKFPADFNLCYIEELKHFISCCEGKEKPLATIEEGIETMQLILAAEKSQQTKKMEFSVE